MISYGRGPVNYLTGLRCVGSGIFLHLHFTVIHFTVVHTLHRARFFIHLHGTMVHFFGRLSLFFGRFCGFLGLSEPSANQQQRERKGNDCLFHGKFVKRNMLFLPVLNLTLTRLFNGRLVKFLD